MTKETGPVGLGGPRRPGGRRARPRRLAISGTSVKVGWRQGVRRSHKIGDDDSFGAGRDEEAHAAVLKRSSRGLGLAASFVGVFSGSKDGAERDAVRRILLGTPVERALAGLMSELRLVGGAPPVHLDTREGQLRRGEQGRGEAVRDVRQVDPSQGEAGDGEEGHGVQGADRLRRWRGWWWGCSPRSPR